MKRGAGNMFWASVLAAKVVSRNALKLEIIFNIKLTIKIQINYFF